MILGLKKMGWSFTQQSTFTKINIVIKKLKVMTIELQNQIQELFDTLIDILDSEGNNGKYDLDQLWVDCTDEILKK